MHRFCVKQCAAAGGLQQRWQRLQRRMVRNGVALSDEIPRSGACPFVSLQRIGKWRSVSYGCLIIDGRNQLHWLALQSGACKRMQEQTVRILNWTPVRRYSETALKAAVATHGPVAVAVYANLNFLSYRSAQSFHHRLLELSKSTRGSLLHYAFYLKEY